MNKRNTKTVSANYMDLLFVPDPSLEYREDGEGRIVIKIEHRGPFHVLAQKIWKKPRFSDISLDRYGSAVWRCLDGSRTVMDVVESMKEQFPEEQERMLDRVVSFLGTLQAHRFVIRKTGKDR